MLIYIIGFCREWPWLLTDAKEKTYQTLNNSTDNSPVPYAKVIEYTSQVKNWDEEVSCIRYLEKASIPGYIVYVDWKNGYKSTHHSSEVYAKCPQKMIEFYEKYLVFTDILKEEIIDIVA
ncbi:hypothetical protein BDF20DRAFT_813709 [Mycotypha africana]|uniref:uncharacterized protein n=1 Tax=Mycotypha africana TaxID=64632 RepID=UPI0023010351|nr:uncharacterized protein BDF20DRAFT_813709 [Mycotypha africana]KAI8987505.1 hypothetical protein BDF20DRAFT_813709 [Mycotypha africana]